MVLFSERHIRYVIQNYVDHYNLERPHKSLDYCRPVEPDTPVPQKCKVKCRERLGGLLKSYYRQAS